MNRSEIKNQINKKLGKEGSVFLKTDHLQSNISEFALKSVQSNTVVINGFCDALKECIPSRASWSENENGDIEFFGVATSDRDEPKQTVERHIKNSGSSFNLLNDCHWDIKKIESFRQRLLSSAKNLSQPMSGKIEKLPEKSGKSESGDAVDSALSEIGVDVVTKTDEVDVALGEIGISGKKEISTGKGNGGSLRDIKLINDYTAVVGTSQDKRYEIRVRCSTSKSENRKKIHVFEYDLKTGESLGWGNKDSYFCVGNLENAEAKLRKIISEMRGQYADSIKIAAVIENLPNGKILFREKDEDMSMEECTKELANWCLEAVRNDDSRIAVYEYQGIKKVAIVKKGAHSLRETFNNVLKDVAPQINPNMLKEYLYENRVLSKTAEVGKKQIHLPYRVKNEYALDSSRAYELNFSEDVMKKLHDTFEKKQRKEIK